MSSISNNIVDVAILGAGTAGLSAGFATASKGFTTQIFGSINTSNLYHKKKVSNYLGVPNTISGPQILQTMMEQAKDAGARFSDARIVSVDPTQKPISLTTETGEKILAKCVIIGTGDNPKQLELPVELPGELPGAAAIAEFSKQDTSWHGKTVAVIGGGDDAVNKACKLAKKAQKVLLIVRSAELKAAEKNKKKLTALQASRQDKLQVFYNSPVKNILSDGAKATGLCLENGALLDVDYVVTAIGRKANTELFSQKLECTDAGYLKTTAGSFACSVPGVFAAGACVDKLYGQKQAVISAGEGMTAGYEAVDYLRSL